jgi:FkbM family methyltransferase
VLHVGAHKAEEISEYDINGFSKVIWVEAQPELAKYLQNHLDPDKHTVICGVAWDTHDDFIQLKVASNSQSSSVLALGTHAKSYPEVVIDKEIVVKTLRLDQVIPLDLKFSLLNIDVQGAELHVLRGLGHLLRNFNMIYSEVNRKYVYENCSLVNEVDAYLKTFGFRRVSTRWMFRVGWGDAIWVNEDSFSLNKRIQATMRNLKFYFFHFRLSFIYQVKSRWLNSHVS